LLNPDGFSNPADTDAASASVVGKIGASLALVRWSSNKPQAARLSTHSLFLDTHLGRHAKTPAQPPNTRQRLPNRPAFDKPRVSARVAPQLKRQRRNMRACAPQNGKERYSMRSTG